MITHIIDNIYQGDWQDAKFIRERDKNISILTVAKDSQFIGDKHYPMIDGDGGPDNIKFLNEAIDYLGEFTSVPLLKPILVHCVSGFSRSTAVVIGYLMKYRKLDYINAYNFVLNRRPFISMNPTFHDYLKGWKP